MLVLVPTLLLGKAALYSRKSLNFRVRPWIKSWIRPWIRTAVDHLEPGGSHLISLCFSFLIYRIGIIIVIVSQGWGKGLNELIHVNHLKYEPGIKTSLHMYYPYYKGGSNWYIWQHTNVVSNPSSLASETLHLLNIQYPVPLCISFLLLLQHITTNHLV